MGRVPNLQGGPSLIAIAGSDSSSIYEAIVSWGSDEVPVSYFYENVWDFSAYSPNRKPSRFYFARWCKSKKALSILELAAIEQFKKLIYLIVYLRNGIPLSITTVKHYFDLIVLMCRYACEQEVGLHHVLSVDKIFLDFVEEHDPSQLRSLAQVISTLQQFPVETLGFVIVGRTMLEEARARQVEFRRDEPAKQHSPLPTRIYSLFISRLVEDLEYNEGMLSRLLDFLDSCSEYRKLPGGKRTRERFVDLLDSHNLHEHFVSRGLTFSLNGLNRAILEVFVSCKLVIHTFSGMRDGEVEYLSRDCLAPVAKSGVKHYMINGYTTKFANGKKKSAKWVVSIEAYRAVDLARKVSDKIYDLVYESAPPSEAPLFLTPAVFWERFRKGNELSVPRLDLCHFKELKARLISCITAEDLQELQDIDPFRIWALEKNFQIGKPWRLTVHQLRRSLALYATRSGLVTLPSLKRQLQHLTEEMTRYYASGSFFAKNLLESYPEHISELYFNSQPESQALSFLKNVLNETELLFGAAGAWYRKPADVEITGESLEETLKKIRNGYLSYTETPVGGCTKVGDCVHRSFGIFSHCLQQCDRSVIKESSLNILISAQQRMVGRLESGSVLWNNEKAILNDYMDARDKIRSKREEK